MKQQMERLVLAARELGATNAAVIDVNKLVFSREFRHLCELNSCGRYGTNWTCPPGVGTLEELEGKIKKYDTGLLIQVVRQLEDSFDFEGMMKAKSDLEEVLEKVSIKIKKDFGYKDLFLLKAGACSICKECTYAIGEKCRFPEKAFPSVEACGIDVKELTTNCGIPYYNGKDTVSYVGVILFK
ncbi:MAG TPA: DUF2284 domain-containing protein [Clostridiaceae bacterium]|nr:DUF2284 domain-containing protein [Clostridiaceae bacterium]